MVAHEAVDDPARAAAGEGACDRRGAAARERARCGSLVPASGQRRNAVPAWTAAAPASSAASTPAVSPMPPGRDERQCRTRRARRPAARAAAGRSPSSRQAPRWPPASAPCTTSASAPRRGRVDRLRGRRDGRPDLGPGRLQTRDVVRRRAAEGRTRRPRRLAVEDDSQLRGVVVVVESRLARARRRAGRPPARARPRTRRSPPRATASSCEHEEVRRRAARRSALAPGAICSANASGVR